MRFLLPIVFFFIIAPIPACLGQAAVNMGIANGLPSNHVYYLKVDKLGYLWLATDKGVIKYNGYRSKKFDLSDGLPVEDIWSLFEDKKGRMWLAGIADGVGYIYNDRYTRAKYSGPPFVFYPKYFRDVTEGVTFISSFIQRTPDIGVVSDTLRLFRFTDTRLNEKFTTPDGSVIMLMRNKVYRLSFRPGEHLRYLCNNLIDYRMSDSLQYKSSMLHSWLFTSDAYIHRLHALNVNSCDRKDIDFDVDEVLYNLHEIGDENELITNKKNYLFDSNMNLLHVTAFEDRFAPELKVQVTHHIKDKFWGGIWATEAQGIFFDDIVGSLTPIADTVELYGTKYVGYGAGIYYWWKEERRTLLAYDETRMRVSPMYVDLGNVVAVGALDSGHLLIATNMQLYRYAPASRHLTPYREMANVKLIQPKDTFVRALKGNYHVHGHYGNIRALIVRNPDTLYINGKGLGVMEVTYTGDTVITNIIDDHRIEGVVYDSVHAKIWMYNHYYLSVYDMKERKLYELTTLFSGLFGSLYIDDVLFSAPHNSVFIKSYDKIICYNYSTHVVKTIYSDFGVKDAHLFALDSQLILAGKSGFTFISDVGGDKFNAVQYPNVKFSNYTEVTDVGYWGHDVLAVTNGGIYSALANRQTREAMARRNASKVVVSYDDTIRGIKTNDTITIQQDSRAINFDIINPNGKGEIKLWYRIKNADIKWQRGDNGYIYLPNLAPGIYHTVYLMAHDDVWQSETYHIILYIRPYWWQTSGGKKLLLAGYVFGALLLVVIIVFITRRVVERHNARRNMKLSLELKSIYAQINPHFIFNSLNTGLFFIKEQKTREAYEHIAAFSDLLRAYIKSARNKFITVNEEVENLENYILLQSGRFENKFDYRVVVRPDDTAGSARIPALIVQPLVENAIVHGLLNKDAGEKGKLLVEFSVSEHGKLVVCKVDDNGIGREASQAMQRQSGVNLPHYGSYLVKELIDILNTYENMYIDINYVDKVHPEVGTTVILTIKYT